VQGSILQRVAGTGSDSVLIASGRGREKEAVRRCWGRAAVRSHRVNRVRLGLGNAFPLRLGYRTPLIPLSATEKFRVSGSRKPPGSGRFQGDGEPDGARSAFVR
jgi:hypothetical protein